MTRGRTIGVLHDEKAMEMMAEFAVNVAHDLNNVLLPICIITEFVMDGFPEDSEVRRNLGKVLLAAEQGKELARKINTVAIPDTTQFHPLDLKTTVSDALQAVDFEIPEHVTFSTHLQDVGAILGDEAQIREIIQALAANALEAIGDVEGGLEIARDPVEFQAGSAAPCESLKPGHYAKLSVTDTGCGIKSAIIPKIFNPSFSTKSGSLGSGFGLSAVYGMVLVHGGDIAVIADPEKPTTFELYFPVLDRE